jgi:hypothetical protein
MFTVRERFLLAESFLASLGGSRTGAPWGSSPSSDYARSGSRRRGARRSSGRPCPGDRGGTRSSSTTARASSCRGSGEAQRSAQQVPPVWTPVPPPGRGMWIWVGLHLPARVDALNNALRVHRRDRHGLRDPSASHGPVQMGKGVPSTRRARVSPSKPQRGSTPRGRGLQGGWTGPVRVCSILFGSAPPAHITTEDPPAGRPSPPWGIAPGQALMECVKN